MSRPALCCYWVRPGRLLAGEHPGASGSGVAAANIDSLIDQGITFVLDLTEEGELQPYGDHLAERAQWVRMAVRDFSVPTEQELVAILDAIDEALEAGHVVYLHCLGGTGRTGTVVGCHLIRHGTPPHDALQQIREWLGDAGRPDRESPETPEQRERVLGWREGA